MKGFDKIKILGEGSHAKVFLVENDQGEELALKVFQPSETEYEDIKKNFLIEAAMLLQVNSPYIVRLYDFSIEVETFHLLMEYCEFGCLKNQLDNNGPFEFSRILNIGLSCLNGLLALHKKERQTRSEATQELIKPRAFH